MNPPHPMESVWKKITGHIGGVALGATLNGLQMAEAEVLPGFLAVAERVLVDLNQTVTPTPPKTAQALSTALQLQLSLRDSGPLPELRTFLEPEEKEFYTVEGPIAASLMTELFLSGFFQECRYTARLCPCLDFLSGLGWWDSDRKILTEQGAIAASLAPQYFHTAGYLRLFNLLPQIMVGDPVLLAEMKGDEHLRRDIDIASSTQVFEATCRTPLREIALPLFDAPLETQPEALVDTGCGEGTLLASLYADIQAYTRRGRHLTEYPLTLVGIDPSPLARTVCHRTLTGLGCPFHVLYGDIGAPEAIAEQLSTLGISPLNSLHISKSVFHNRGLQTSVCKATNKKNPGTQNVFIREGGEIAPPEMVEEDLLQLMHRWKPLARQYGLLIIEAHTMNAAEVIRRDMLPILALNDATHGYTGQYLLEAEVFQSLLKRAGLIAEKIEEVGTVVFGNPIMTIGLYRVH